MKVGVITFHSAYNFGASLQTWALQKVLKKYNIETGVINYHPSVIDDLYDPIKVTGFKRPFKIISLRMKNKDGLKRYYAYKKFIQNSFNLLGDYSTYEELSKANLDLDAYITGSDQVWNSQHIGGFDPSYFLDFVPDNATRISYAASIGRNYIIPKYQEQFKNSLDKFDYISVREESAAPVIGEITSNNVEVVIDPTLLLEKEEYEELIIKPSIDEKYIFVYMMEDNREVVNFANKISKAIGLPIIQRRQKKKFKNEIGTCYTGTPGDFIGLIDNAELVITNSFHGTVFSVICETPFLSMLHSDTGSRTIDLLKSMGLSSHIVSNINDSIDIKMATIEDIGAVKKRIKSLRSHSLLFLEEALSLNGFNDMVECPTNIKKSECYGCYACKEICPTKAITMTADLEGFFYPIVSEDKCIHCNACAKACIRNKPITVQYEKSYPQVYSAILKDEEVRMGSSSGAIFPALAKYAVDKGGIVVGVKFDENMRAVSALAQTHEEVKAFYGSKYVKSYIDGIFPKVKEGLEAGRFVLYTGLPCECSGLRAYLKKDYDNLLICEIMCHASPSPKVLEKYIGYLNKKFKSKVNKIEFRNKATGWETYKCSLVIGFEDGQEINTGARRNNYFRAFTNDYIARRNCTKCNFVYKNRAGDITMGDFWGIQDISPSMYDGKGTSMLLLNTSKAVNVWEEIKDQFIYEDSTMEKAFRKNHKRPIKLKAERMELFRELDTEPIDPLLKRFNDLKNKK